MIRLGVLASGSGSNLKAILDACASGSFPAQVAVVIANVPTARALSRAREAGVPAVLLPHAGASSREGYDGQLVKVLHEHEVELVCLAGFMRLITPVLLRAFENKILNIHPSLLPAFPGLHAARQALAAGARVSGCTVHLVDAGTDTGPILLQAAVPVLDDDDEETLAARILVQEHRAYPRAIALWAAQRFSFAAVSRRVRVRDAAADAGQTLASPRLED